MINSFPANVVCITTRPNAMLTFAFESLGALASCTSVHAVSGV